MYKIKNKNIYLNRGDRTIISVVNNSDTFKVGDYLIFYICKKGDYSNVVFSKQINVLEESYKVDIVLTSEETKLEEPLKDGVREYYYEIELNGEITLVGYGEDGPKLLILYPEAIETE